MIGQKRLGKRRSDTSALPKWQPTPTLAAIISTWRVNCGPRRKKSTRLGRLQISGEESGLAARMAVRKSRAPSPGAARSIQEPHVTTARPHRQVVAYNNVMIALFNERNYATFYGSRHVD